MTYKIDAQNRALGRVATEAAHILRGKNNPDFLAYKDSGNVVEISGVEKVRVTGQKMDSKLYWHFTGYPGGIKKKTLREVMAFDKGRALRGAVYGMLPKNKLRDRMIKRLIIK